MSNRKLEAKKVSHHRTDQIGEHCGHTRFLKKFLNSSQSYYMMWMVRRTYDAATTVVAVVAVAAVRSLLGIYILSEDGGRTYQWW